MANRYLSIDCTKIRNDSKRTKTSQNEIMQSITSNIHSRPLFPNPIHKQAGFGKPAINGRGYICLGISKMVFTF